MTWAILLALLPAAAPAQSFDPFGEAKIVQKPGAQVPVDTAFVTADGRRVTLRQIGQGRPILLAPVLHHCPNLCGVTLAGLSDAVKAQPGTPGRDFTVVAFGIDPREGVAEARDALASLQRRNRGTPLLGYEALVGARANIRAVTDAIGYHYAWDPRIGQYAHAAAVAVLTPDGRLSGWLYGLSPSPRTLAAALRSARAGQAAPPANPLLLLCYHYDPATGRYTPAITKILRLAGGATIAALAVTMLTVRRRRT